MKKHKQRKTINTVLAFVAAFLIIVLLTYWITKKDYTQYNMKRYIDYNRNIRGK